MNRLLSLLPYWLLLFSIGFGWFIMAPLAPDLAVHYNVGASYILLMISLYGYTMVAIGLLSGAMSARFTARLTIMLAGLLSLVGLAGRAVYTGFHEALAFQIVAAAAYPLAMAPVGSIAASIDQEKAHTIVGISVGSLFLGMATGSFMGAEISSRFGLNNTLIMTAILAAVALAFVSSVIRSYPAQYKGRPIRGSFEPSMIKNWYIGLAISSLAIMFSSIASLALLGQNVQKGTAEFFAGTFGSLAFLGSALGAMILPPMFERSGTLKDGLVMTSVLSLVSVFVLAYSLVNFSHFAVTAAGYFLFGFFGNSFWSMAMTSTTKYVNDPGQAGFATSMFSVATNLGVAFIPEFLGPYFISSPVPGITAVVLMVLVSFALSPGLRVKSGEDQDTFPDST